MTKLAMKIAFKAHDGQVDKGGLPYINHPLHIAEYMKDEDSTIVALLHDVIEDSLGVYTPEKLREFGFSEEIVNAVDILSHRKHVPYMEYIKLVKENELSRIVKIADLNHNLEISRLGDIDEKTSRKIEKYHEAKAYLEAA